MLFEFHKWQNDKRPGSLHATYLVYGTNKPSGDEDGDVDMTSSQMSEDYPPLRFSEEVHTETLTLAREEQLEGKLTRWLSASILLKRADLHMQRYWPSTTRSGQFMSTVLDHTP